MVNKTAMVIVVKLTTTRRYSYFKIYVKTKRQFSVVSSRKPDIEDGGWASAADRYGFKSNPHIF